MSRDHQQQHAYKRRHVAGGFTLIELLITIAILALLAGSAFSLVELAATRSREQELRVALREIRGALDAYKAAVDAHRIPKEGLEASGYPKSLEILEEGVTDPKDIRGRKIYFLRRVPRDPMATDASLAAAQTWGQRSYQSGPDEPQSGEDIYDVYSQSDKTGLNGVPYRKW